MMFTRRTGAVLAGTILALAGPQLVSGASQLVMEDTFLMETTACQGVSCRKEIIGANETFGLGAHAMCTKGETYGVPPMPPSINLFELVYSCRKDSALGEEIVSKDDCGIKSACLDASTDPETSEITYQIAFEFKSHTPIPHDVSVNVKLYFNYHEVHQTFYTLRSSVPVKCELQETCHRGCAANEYLFLTRLTDVIGDGWNAGGINLFDHFRLDNYATVASAMPDALPTTQASVAAARRASYKNTMLSGKIRHVPLCLADGEYLFSTEFSAATPGEAEGSESVAVPGGAGQRFESSWSFCGETGTLSDFAYFRVSGGLCEMIDTWGLTLQPTAAPTTDTLAPEAPVHPSSNDDNDDDGTDERTSSRGSGSKKMTDLEILGVGCAALFAAGLAAVGGTYAQKRGWFAAAGGSGAAGVAGAGAAGGAPNPDVDEFAP